MVPNIIKFTTLAAGLDRQCPWLWLPVMLRRQLLRLDLPLQIMERYVPCDAPWPGSMETPPCERRTEDEDEQDHPLTRPNETAAMLAPLDCQPGSHRKAAKCGRESAYRPPRPLDTIALSSSCSYSVSPTRYFLAITSTSTS